MGRSINTSVPTSEMDVIRWIYKSIKCCYKLISSTSMSWSSVWLYEEHLVNYGVDKSTCPIHPSIQGGQGDRTPRSSKKKGGSGDKAINEPSSLPFNLFLRCDFCCYFCLVLTNNINTSFLRFLIDIRVVTEHPEKRMVLQIIRSLRAVPVEVKGRRRVQGAFWSTFSSVMIQRSLAEVSSSSQLVTQLVNEEHLTRNHPCSSFVVCLYRRDLPRFHVS